MVLTCKSHQPEKNAEVKTMKIGIRPMKPQRCKEIDDGSWGCYKPLLAQLVVDMSAIYWEVCPQKGL
jgi:hypothetical protein